MQYVYPLVSWIYLAVPLVAIGIAVVVARRTRRARPLRVLLRTLTTGGVLGGAVATLYASIGGAPVPPGQVALACYLGAATLCIVFALNWALYQGVSRLFQFRRPEGPAPRRAQIAAGAMQGLLLIVLGLPYLGSVLFLYRPEAPSHGTPATLVDAPMYQVVHFRATDTTPLEAWWIPAQRNARTDGRGSVQWGRDTVLFCPGFRADKASQLFLVQDLVANGYNVLAVDLRAHGRSGGQFTGLGTVESRDVLGTVRWLRANHPAECGRILGLGESLGAVALIEAAADPGPEGQAIDAIAAYNPYDAVADVVNEVARHHTIPVGQWALRHVIVPVASAQVGTDLARASTGLAVRSLWPRPLLVIGNPAGGFVGGADSFDLYQDALQPKYAYFRDDADANALLHDPTAALTVRIFFDEERSIL
jgi:pimeloyl-ACP methyl ester carboxylesterase